MSTPKYLPDGCVLNVHGTLFDFLKPTSDFDVSAAVHTICNLPRFGGHLRDFYSVGAHCCYVHDLVKSRHPENKELQLAALTHDLSEFAFGDIVTPAKRHIKSRLPEFATLIEAWEYAVALRMNLPYATYEDLAIQQADTDAMLAEAFDLGSGMLNTQRPELDLVPHVSPSAPGAAFGDFFSRLYNLGFR